MEILKRVFKKDGKIPFDIIKRSGRRLNENQVDKLLEWLNKDGK